MMEPAAIAEPPALTARAKTSPVSTLVACCAAGSAPIGAELTQSSLCLRFRDASRRVLTRRRLQACQALERGTEGAGDS